MGSCVRTENRNFGDDVGCSPPTPFKFVQNKLIDFSPTLFCFEGNEFVSLCTFVVLKSILLSNFSYTYFIFVRHFSSFIRYFREQGNDMNRSSYNVHCIFQKFHGWKWNGSDRTTTPTLFQNLFLPKNFHPGWKFANSVWTFAWKFPPGSLKHVRKAKDTDWSGWKQWGDAW